MKAVDKYSKVQRPSDQCQDHVNIHQQHLAAHACKEKSNFNAIFFFLQQATIRKRNALIYDDHGGRLRSAYFLSAFFSLAEALNVQIEYNTIYLFIIYVISQKVTLKTAVPSSSRSLSFLDVD